MPTIPSNVRTFETSISSNLARVLTVHLLEQVVEKVDQAAVNAQPKEQKSTETHKVNPAIFYNKSGAEPIVHRPGSQRRVPTTSFSSNIQLRCWIGHVYTKSETRTRENDGGRTALGQSLAACSPRTSRACSWPRSGRRTCPAGVRASPCCMDIATRTTLSSCPIDMPCEDTVGDNEVKTKQIVIVRLGWDARPNQSWKKEKRGHFHLPLSNKALCGAKIKDKRCNAQSCLQSQ